MSAEDIFRFYGDEVLFPTMIPQSFKVPSDFAFTIDLHSDDSFVGFRAFSDQPVIKVSGRLKRSFDQTVTGNFKIWFTQDGEARISFEDEQDATLFRLALEGGAS